LNGLEDDLDSMVSQVEACDRQGIEVLTGQFFLAKADAIKSTRERMERLDSIDPIIANSLRILCRALKECECRPSVSESQSDEPKLFLYQVALENALQSTRRLIGQAAKRQSLPFRLRLWWRYRFCTLKEDAFETCHLH
jgi:hypothetical protein